MLCFSVVAYKFNGLSQHKNIIEFVTKTPNAALTSYHADAAAHQPKTNYLAPRIIGLAHNFEPTSPEKREYSTPRASPRRCDSQYPSGDDVTRQASLVMPQAHRSRLMH
ncbi:MAG TPA: hypothetical protein DEF45_11265 [Rhodopirellula sp.]|nr:hypothetical protein [Rhodopirellula sp.]